MSTRPETPAVHGRQPAATRGRQLALGALMGAEAASLAVMALLHLSSALAFGTQPFSELGAGLGEAVICVVLAYGALRLLTNTPHARLVALASTVFAIAGFAVGLTITLQGGAATDVVFHLVMIPVLVLTFRVLRRLPPNQGLPTIRQERSLP